MNPVVETLMKDLINETRQHGPGALHAILNVFYGSYLAGKHNDLARHCCDFSSAGMLRLSSSVSQQTGAQTGSRDYEYSGKC